jgi:hypothetical protein
MTEYQYFNPTDDPLMTTVDSKTLRLIDDARGKSGVPWRITSAGRSRDQNNAQKDSVKDSAHLCDPETGLCQAVDLDCRDNHRLWCMIFGLMNQGARRIGVYFTRCEDDPNKLIPRHIHVDTDPDKPQEVLFCSLEV